MSPDDETSRIPAESHAASAELADAANSGPFSRAHLPFPVVGIGASAGSVTELVGLFGSLPEKPGMAFVVVVHLSPQHESRLDAILSRGTAMPVLQVRESVPIEPNKVYVISPALQLSMSDGHLHVETLRRPPGRHLAIDLFFRTLAEVQRERAVCVVLSGTGADGSLGVQRVKEFGGVALAQAPSDAEYPDMPKNAIATGAVDFVLPVAEIGDKLVSLWEIAQRMELPSPAIDTAALGTTPIGDAAEQAERALTDVMLMLRGTTGHDFRHYKRSTVLRRIGRRLQVNGVVNLPDYRDFLQDHPEESWALLNDLLISVTNFFRDRDAFDALEHELPSVMQPPRAKVRAWVAACATGEEAYSIAMMLVERARNLAVEPSVQVFASDIDERAIAVARTGLYPDTVVADLSPARLSEFLQKEQGNVRVRKELREKVLFASHNLLRDPPFSKLDLVCCRNLLIYLDREVQLQVLQLFHFALRPGGLLFLGTSESADAAAELFAPVDKKNRIYRADGIRRGRMTAPMLPSDMKLNLPNVVTARAVPDSRSMLGDLHERLRQSHESPSVLVDAANNVLHSTPGASSYLRFVPGQPSQNLLDAVLPELRVELRTALALAWLDGKSVEARRVHIGENDEAVWITITLRPIRNQTAPLMLVYFDETQSSFAVEAAEGAARDPMLVMLEDELQRTREQLHGSLGESAASTEELRASNEELQAMNEELRSATEELETGKEELQSVNEELYTVNQELKVKVEETGRTNDDLKNLIVSTDIATIFIDRDMHIKRFTPRASQLFNLIEGDIGRSLLDITRRLEYPQLERDAGDAFESLRTIEREVHGKDQRIYLARVLPYRTQHDVIDGAVLTFIDISATRRAQEQLRIGEANLRDVVERTQDYSIITLDVQGLVTTWNLGARRMFGFDDAEIVGHPIDLLFTPEDRASDAPQLEMRRARDEGRAVDERWHMHKDGRPFYCSGIMTPVYQGSELCGYAKIARDRTESKRSESQLETLLIQEKETRAELQRAIAMKDEFLAVMSHELKHPLNLIHVNAELLSRMPQVRDAPNVARAADVIRRTVMSQAKIIDDLLDLSRLRTGKLALSTSAVEWAAIVMRVLDAVAGDARELRLTIEHDLAAAASPIDADPVRAEQIVWNLISNALKFTPPGGSIRVVLSVDGKESRLDVIDDGQGVAPDALERVFDMFRQADRSTTRSQGGMGIGLALVKQLAEAHGGRVAAHSGGAGKGSTFSVWLPLALWPADRPADSASVPALSGMRILVVDDAEDALESFKSLLELEGADVIAVSGAVAALATLERTSVDLLLSDVAMPGMDGYELIVALRQRPATARLPAIALTGFGRPLDARRALAAGFDAHLSKPVVVDELLQTIHRLPREPREPPAPGGPNLPAPRSSKPT